MADVEAIAGARSFVEETTTKLKNYSKLTKTVAKITKNTTLEKILDIKGAEEIMAEYNLPCLSCPMAAQEISKLKLGEVAKAYDLDLKGMIKKLNGKFNN